MQILINIYVFSAYVENTPDPRATPEDDNLK